MVVVLFLPLFCSPSSVVSTQAVAIIVSAVAVAVAVAAAAAAASLLWLRLVDNRQPIGVVLAWLLGGELVVVAVRVVCFSGVVL